LMEQVGKPQEAMRHIKRSAELAKSASSANPNADKAESATW